MKKSSVFMGVTVFLIGLMIALAGIATWLEWDSVRHEIAYTNRVRQMAAVDDPKLADLLDGSVVFIEAGDFLMGSDNGRLDERPQRTVYLDAYEIDRFEVTNLQYHRFLEVTGGKPPSHWSEGKYPQGQADYPIVGISWEDAAAYCIWAGKRLPTEAEWEKACRGTDGRNFPWGDAWDASRANVLHGDSYPYPSDFTSDEMIGKDAMWISLLSTPSDIRRQGLRPVGTYPYGASPYGVFDMTGNASEWVFDWYNWSDYSEMPAQNPIGTTPPWNHCLRGSSWYYPLGDREWALKMSRCSTRNSSHVATDPRLGFRCAR